MKLTTLFEQNTAIDLDVFFEYLDGISGGRAIIKRIKQLQNSVPTNDFTTGINIAIKAINHGKKSIHNLYDVIDSFNSIDSLSAKKRIDLENFPWASGITPQIGALNKLSDEADELLSSINKILTVTDTFFNELDDIRTIAKSNTDEAIDAQLVLDSLGITMLK